MPSRPRLENNRYGGLFCTYAYPALYPEGTWSTRVRLEAGLLTVGVACRTRRWFAIREHNLMYAAKVLGKPKVRRASLGSHMLQEGSEGRRA